MISFSRYLEFVDKVYWYILLKVKNARKLNLTYKPL